MMVALPPKLLLMAEDFKRTRFGQEVCFAAESWILAALALGSDAGFKWLFGLYFQSQGAISHGIAELADLLLIGLAALLIVLSVLGAAIEAFLSTAEHIHESVRYHISVARGRPGSALAQSPVPIEPPQEGQRA
jgi:hypothetical protein